jgi:hypothetical protein
MTSLTDRIETHPWLGTPHRTEEDISNVTSSKLLTWPHVTRPGPLSNLPPLTYTKACVKPLAVKDTRATRRKV